MYEINITVVNTMTNEVERPDKYNTFWNDGVLTGIQNYLVVRYDIILHPNYERDNN